MVAVLVFAGAATHAQTLTSTVKGAVVPARSWNVSAEVSNKINRIHFVEGQHVSSGDLLVEFDTAFKAAELDLADAQLAKAAVALEKAREDLSRQKTLRAKSTISEAAYLDAQFAARLAEADFNVLKIQRDMAEGILLVQKLYAPFDGQISAPRFAENTSVLPVPNGHIATIVQLDPIRVRAPQPLERVLDRLSSGEANIETLSNVSVSLQLPNGVTYPHKGRIISWSVGLDEDTQQAVAIVEFPNPDHILRPGMKVSVSGYEE